MNSLFGAFIVELGLVTFRTVRNGGIVTPTTAPIPAPLPSLYTSAILIYGGLALIPGRGAPLAGLIGWGFVVATALNLWSPSAANEKAAVASKTATTLGAATKAAHTTALNVPK